ncbi:PAS domain S-box protein [Methanoculleus sp.]|uniref:sensor histidine kinase n=2 Tax=Methanoculleus sp. TaxID=90427 RepID=UPI0025F7C568|nr:PAS domain S-box protein [Methanoculleus sp.]MCK9318214.1 PAS domain S-box protein [Methanoculleus sp.]
MTPVNPPEHSYGAPAEYRILEDLDDAVLVIGEGCTPVWANPAFRRIFGGEDGESGATIRGLAGRLQAATGERIPAFECRFPAPDGKERRCLVSGRRGPSGKGWVLLLRGIPDEKSDYEVIVEYTGTATILIGGDGTILVANTEFERFSGHSRGEIVGIKRLADFITSDEERERIMGYHALRRRAPGAAPKNYSFTFTDRSGVPHLVEATIGLIPGTDRSVISLLDVTGRKRAERALHESEERLNLAFSAANDGLVDWNVSSSAIFYSPRSFTMLGYEPDAFVPTIPTLLALVHPEDRGRVEAAITALATGERDHAEMEFRMRSASGEWVYLLDRLRVVGYDAGGRPNRIVGTHTDITERKEAERELLIRKMAMESSFAAIAIADLDGRITYANQALLAMAGFTDPAEVIGKHLSHPWIDTRKVGEALGRLAEQDRCTGELVGRRIDGTEFIAHVTANFVTDESGTPVCIMATAVDITAERRMAEALRESEERYRKLAESAPDIIFLVGVGGDALYANGAGARLLGTDPESLRGKNLRELFPPDVANRWLAMIRLAAEQNGDILTEETRLPGDQGGIWLETRLIPMRESDGTVRRLLGISRDVTGRKRAEEQLRFQARVLSQVEEAVIATDTRGRIAYMNRAAERLYGAPPDGDSGRPGSELFTREWLRPEDEEEMQSALQSSGTWQGIVRHRRWDGETILVDETLSTLNDDSGRITGTLCSLRDVTAQKRAEQELRIKDMAIASSLDAICLTDLDGRIIYANRAFLSMHGWEREEEILGQPATVLWADPEEAERVVEAFHRDGTWLGEVEGRRRDGSTFPMQLALSSVTDETGKPLCRMGSGIDITRRKEAERDLRIKDMAIASSPSAFTIADLDGRHIYVNQAFLSLWGYDSPSEVIGRPITEFWQDGQILTSSGRYTGERIGKRRDGSTFCAIFSGNVVTDDTGAPIGRAASLIDITSIKRAEREIQAHNRALSVLNQLIGVSASAMDIDEMLESVLAATLALLDLAGGGIYLIEPGRLRARLVCADGLPEGFPARPCIPDIAAPPYADVLVAGEPRFYDDHPGEGGETPHPYASIPIMAHDRIIGALNVVSESGGRFTDADRSLLTAIGREIGTSVERTMLIRQLEMAEREANLYLDILSHDIRNAENVSGLYTDLLVETLDGETKGYAQKLQASIRKSIEILRNVSTIRRIHQESTVLGPVDLDRVIREEIGMFPEIRFCYDGTDLAVMADALLSEVFTNLIGNAIKFGGPAVEITIRVEARDGEVQVSVEDTGPGVPDAMKESIFMRFGQSKHRKSGQGLGLYITRMLVSRYGGRVRVGDRVPGRPECGAAFRFSLRRS